MTTKSSNPGNTGLMSSDNQGMFLPFLQRLSYAKKAANNFRWCEKMADFYDWHYMYDYKAEQEKFLVNSDLFNGRGRELDYMDDNTLQALKEEGIEVGYQKIRHHDILSNIAKNLHGDLIKRPFVPMAHDISDYNSTVRTNQQNEMLLQSIQADILEPLKKEVLMQWSQEHGIKDLYSMSPEEQQQAQSDIDQRVDQRTPEDIKKFMSKIYKTPSEREAQKLLNFYTKELDMEFKRSESFKMFITTGKIIFYTGIRNGRVVCDVINPVGFYAEGSKNKYFIQDYDWCKYESYIKYSDIFANYGSILTNQDVKDIERMYTGYWASGGGAVREPEYGKMVAEISNNPEKYIQDGINIRSREGQQHWQEVVKSSLGSYARGNAMTTVRDLHVCYTSLRKLKYIKRYMPKEDDMQGFWCDETYEFNRANGDIEESVSWITQKWGVHKIGYSSSQTAIYVDKAPIPYQYTSLNNPFSCQLPYVGIEYGKMQGNSRTIAPIDPGKPWQYKFNLELARIEEAEGTNLGNVLLFLMKAKPEKWPLGKFLSIIRAGKIVPVDLDSEGMRPDEMNVFKSINLSNEQDIQAKLQRLEFIKNQAAFAMCYNPSRLGQISPYMTATNNQQSIMQSLSQTEDLYSTFNKVLVQTLTAMLRAAKVALKKDKIQRTIILDDLSAQNLNVDWECLAYSELQVFISNTGDDYDNMLAVKQKAEMMIQNQMITFPELVKLQWAKSGAEILALAEQAEQKREKMLQDQAKAQQEAAQQQLQHEKEMRLMEQEFEAMMMDKKIQGELLRTQIDSMKFAKQFDIDQDGQNDQSENADKKLDFEYRKLQVEKELKEKEIAANKNKPKS